MSSRSLSITPWHHCCHESVRMAPLPQLQENLFHHVNDMTGLQWSETTTDLPRFSFPCMVLFVVSQASNFSIKKADTCMDAVIASHKLRGSVPVRNSTLYLAAFNAGLRGNGLRCSRTYRNRSCHLAACVDVLPVSSPRFPASGWQLSFFVHYQFRPSQRCCTGVSKCTCHAVSMPVGPCPHDVIMSFVQCSEAGQTHISRLWRIVEFGIAARTPYI